MDYKTFGDELTFLEKYIEVILLSDVTGNSQIVVSPQLQGRVMSLAHNIVNLQDWQSDKFQQCV